MSDSKNRDLALQKIASYEINCETILKNNEDLLGAIELENFRKTLRQNLERAHRMLEKDRDINDIELGKIDKWLESETRQFEQDLDIYSAIKREFF